MTKTLKETDDLHNKLDSLKLTDEKTNKKKSEPEEFDWDEVDCWVDDDFDADDMFGTGPIDTRNNDEGVDEDDWDDTDDDYEDDQTKDKRYSTVKSKVSKMKEPVISNDQMRKKINGIPKGPKKTVDNVRRKNEKYDEGIRQHVKGKEKHEGKNKGNEWRHSENKNKIPTDLERLMPVAGWKPGNNEAKFVNAETHEQFEQKQPREKKVYQGHYNNDKEHSDNKRKHKNYKKNMFERNENNNSNNTDDTHIVRIHYTEDEKNNDDINNKTKKIFLESRWANDNVESKPKVVEPIKNSREMYRQQKLKNQLDWDKGIRYRPGDSDIESDSEYDDQNEHSKKQEAYHQHFSYSDDDNNNNNNNKPVDKKAEPKSNKPEKEIKSMWA